MSDAFIHLANLRKGCQTRGEKFSAVFGGDHRPTGEPVALVGRPAAAARMADHFAIELPIPAGSIARPPARSAPIRGGSTTCSAPHGSWDQHQILRTERIRCEMFKRFRAGNRAFVARQTR